MIEKPESEEYLMAYVKNQQMIPCSVAHKGKCWENSLHSALKATWNFKKALSMVFLFSLLKERKKMTSLAIFLAKYIKFFKNPLIFIFVFNYFGKWLMCKVKNNP